MRSSRPVPLLLVVSLALGCESAPALVVDLRTDFAPGLEVGAVITELWDGLPDGAGAPIASERRAVTAGDDFADFARVAELEARRGDFALRVQLEDPAGEPLAEKTQLVNVTESAVVPVWITRRCARVFCDDGLTCVDGECVDPSCTTGGGPGCPEGCDVDGDCPDPGGCLVASCGGGACLETADDGLCAPGERCHPSRGCEPEPVRADAGPGCDPQPETCNERDDDCDGLVDESFDLSSDESHCGGCGDACPDPPHGSAECVGGVCGIDCDVTWVDCDGDGVTCEADLSSDETCGGCDIRCSSTQECLYVGGSYLCSTTCSVGETDCGGACVATATDESNCGGCGVTCGAGETCSSGRCACGPDAGSTGSGAVCSGSATCCGSDGCANLSTDESSCGACGVSCGDGETCVSGACTCGSTTGTAGGGQACFGSQACCPPDGCVFTRLDNDHCGGCDMPCAAPAECAMSVCRVL